MFSKSIQAQVFESVEYISGLDILEENNGVAVADYDGDLDLDIFVVAKARPNSFKKKTISRLFRNNSNGTFTDVTEEAGLKNIFDFDTSVTDNNGVDGIKTGVSWGDYDNDGFPDILLTSLSEIHLMHNLGNGSFKDVSLEAGLNIKNGCANMGSTWFDANNDGFLDIYITDWGECSSNSFYLNQGNGTFINKTQEFFGDVPRKSSYMSLPFDFNADGWMDLYVSEDFSDANEVYINQSGNGFVDRAVDYGLDNKDDDMGIAIGDYNNDNFFDIYIATINENRLFENKQNNTFEDVGNIKQVKDAGWAWGPIFEDFDLDGDEDLFVTNGFREANPVAQENKYYKNLNIEQGDGFISVSQTIGISDFATSVTPVAFDYDNDGDLDLFVTNSDKPSHFYENKIIDSNSDLNWFKVVLRGTLSNRDAIGAIVSITTSTATQTKHNSTVTHLSQSIKPIYFGLGSETVIEKINIKWPSGLEESYNTFSSNNSVLFIENGGFEDYKIPQVVKKKGCIDPYSCNYDPEAIIDDGSCVYLDSNKISGNSNPNRLSIETYTYISLLDNSNFSWSVSGGEIIEGQGTNSVTVKWGIQSAGHISVREINANCSNRLVALAIKLSTSISNKHSISRLWNEALLIAIRNDLARPTIHARNLFHTSIAMYDAWAIYDEEAKPYLIGNTVNGFTSNFSDFISNENSTDAIKKTISYAAYRLLSYRFENSPGAEKSIKLFQDLMNDLGYDVNFDATDYTSGSAAALGNFIAETVIRYGNNDGSREESDYDNAFYKPINRSLSPFRAGNPTIADPNRWQPLSLNEFIDQSGNLVENSTPDFLSPEWGNVYPFALSNDDKTTYERDGDFYNVFNDPLSPPYLNLNRSDDSSEAYKWGFSLVSIWGAHLDPSDGVLWDISPQAIGNIDFERLPLSYEDYPEFYKLIEGGDIGKGYDINPITNTPYEKQLVPRGDYARVLAEFWADGPDSETPPGHWFTLLNYVNDHPLLEKRLQGEGDILNDLEWDVKSYFLLGGAMHDAAISAWSVKGWYDYIRPISAIRYMAGLGQSSDTFLNNYHIAGIPLREGYVEVVKSEDPLAGRQGEHIGKIKLYTWRGHDFINDIDVDTAGVGWILAENWWPYQRPSFVTPPFAGYVSGHSTYSRAAAELLTLLTGDAYFPGGIGEFVARKNEFLVFEEGPSVDVKLQWATYKDASDQCSLSRIWGGIHPPADDIPGRIIGEKIGKEAFTFGIKYFNGEKQEDEATQKYKVYPNPINSNGTLFISNTTKHLVYELVDLNGKIIKIDRINFDQNSKTTQVDLPKHLNRGVYILKIGNTSNLIIK